MKTRIGIIGAGFSGTMMAVHLLKISANSMNIYLIDECEFGRGLAYKEIDDDLLLNVPTDLMGAYPDEVDHFFKWAKNRLPQIEAKSFASRSLYGQYLLEQLEEARLKKHASITIELIKDKAVEIDSVNKKIILKNQRELEYDEVVLAIGAQKAKPFVVNPSDEEAVTILGTGLSMVDAIIRINKVNSHKKIIAVSRNGYMPQPHKIFSKETKRPVFDSLQTLKLLDMLKIVREEFKHYDWRLVIDALRPLTQKIWLNMSESDKGKFLRHLRPLWDVHRHRITSTHHEMLQSLQKNETLKILKIGYKPYAPKTTEVIDCRGPSFLQDELIAQLIEKKLVMVDKFKLGVTSKMPWLHILGPLKKGDLWESTAVPELRVMARDLAVTLIEKYR